MGGVLEVDDDFGGLVEVSTFRGGESNVSPMVLELLKSSCSSDPISMILGCRDEGSL